MDTYGTRDPELTQIFTPSKELKLKPNFKIDLGLFSSEVSSEKVSIADLPIIVQEVNLNLAEYVIYSLNPDHKYYVLFDQLDLGFDPANPDYNNRLIGLLLAARDINNMAKSQSRNLGVSIFLRDDIYNSLKFENKLTVGYSNYIEWDMRGKHTLKDWKDLMERRFQEVLRETDEEVVSWDDVFDETQMMTGRQSEYNYITDRTNKIDNKEIYSAKDEYSKARANPWAKMPHARYFRKSCSIYAATGEPSSSACRQPTSTVPPK